MKTSVTSPAEPERQVFNGAELRRRRTAKGIKRTVFAVMLDRSGEQVTNYELGRTVPPMGVLLAMCEILDCEPGDLVIRRPSAAESRIAQGLAPTITAREADDIAGLFLSGRARAQT
jgi:transcriptional regulator with XRE-family HTH domain